MVIQMQRGSENQRDTQAMEKFSSPSPNGSGTTFPPNKLNLQPSQFSSYHQPEELKSLAQVVQDTELDIFQAERYFKDGQGHKEINKSYAVVEDGTTDVSSTPRVSSVSSVSGYGRNYTSGCGSFHATPTASSEASWNSRSGLLSNPPGSTAVDIRNLHLESRKKKGSSPTKWCFGRICPCSGKKSVGVIEESLSEPNRPFHLHSDSNGGHRNVAVDRGSSEKAKGDFEHRLGTDKRSKMNLANGSWRKEQDVVVDRESAQLPPKTTHFTSIEIGTTRLSRSFRDTTGGFSFPVLNPSSISNGGKVKPSLTSETTVQDPPRESLEVYQPPVEESVRHKSAEFRRPVLPDEKENNHQGFSFLASPKTGMAIDDDLASDGSSDLFEIESLSTQTTSFPMSNRRTSLDEISSIAPTECYEPSEASINWSVTTAEGLDGASVTNMSITSSESCTESNSYKDHINGGSKRKGNGLLNSRCEKAVNVGPHPMKCTAEQCHVGLSFPVEAGKSPSKSQLGNISSLQVTKASGKPPLAMSHPTRASCVITRH